MTPSHQPSKDSLFGRAGRVFQPVEGKSGTSSQPLAQGSPPALCTATPWLGPVSEQGNILLQRQGGGTVSCLASSQGGPWKPSPTAKGGTPSVQRLKGPRTWVSDPQAFRTGGLQNLHSPASYTLSKAPAHSPLCPAPPTSTSCRGFWGSLAEWLPQDPSTSRDIPHSSPQLRGSQWVGGVGVRKTV